MSILNKKTGLNRLFPFAKKKPNIPAKLSDKVDSKLNKQKLVDDKNCALIKTIETIRCDVLIENNEKGRCVQENSSAKEISKNDILETFKEIPSQNDNTEIKPKNKKSITRKSSKVSETSIESIKKPKENYQRWNIPFSSKFKGKEFDKTLLTMQDLIYYNPVTNPIIKEPKVEQNDDDPDNDLLSIKSDQKPAISSNNCITPCIKVGIDGKIIIDQETLTLNETGLEEKREELAKAKVIEESAFHSRSYSYKRKKEPSKQWTKDETLKFYKCLMNLGTDFSMIEQYFPGRTRAQIKRKYKTEEKKNPQLINGALTNTTHYDSVLIENMFQEDEPEVIEESKIINVDSNVSIQQLTTHKRLHKDTTRSECGRMSVCAYMMKEEIVQKKKRKPPCNILTANEIKEGILALQSIKDKKTTEIKTKTETTLTNFNKKQNDSIPKVRRLQDFHEEFEENISKYEEDSNSE